MDWKPLSELRSVTCHIGSHSVTCHLTWVNVPRLNPSTRFTYPGGMEGWVDLGVGYIPRWFTCPQTVTHPSSNRESNRRPFDHESNVITVTPPSRQCDSDVNVMSGAWLQRGTAWLLTYLVLVIATWTICLSRTQVRTELKCPFNPPSGSVFHLWLFVTVIAGKH